MRPTFIAGAMRPPPTLRGEYSCDIPSTAQLDLVADWDDVVDDPTAGLLDVDNMLRHIHTIAFSVPLPEPFGTPWGPEIGVFLKQGRENEIEFHTLSPEQETPEHFRLGLLANSTSGGVTVQERNRLAAAAAHIEKLRPHELGDTKYRTVSYQMVASTRFANISIQACRPRTASVAAISKPLRC